MVKRLLLTIFSLSFIVSTANADFVETTQSWTTTLTDACDITNSPSVADTFNGTSDRNGSFAVNVLCSGNLAWTLTAGAGNNASGELRRFKNGTSYIPYRLYKDSGMTQEIAVTGNNSITGSGSGAEQATPLFYSIRKSDFTGATQTDHTDTVRFTISW